MDYLVYTILLLAIAQYGQVPSELEVARCQLRAIAQEERADVDYGRADDNRVRHRIIVLILADDYVVGGRR